MYRDESTNIRLKTDCKQLSEADFSLTYNCYGDQSKPLMIVLGGLSGDRFSADSQLDGESIKGWWSLYIGDDKAIDLNDFHVLSIDYYSGSKQDALDQKHISTHYHAKLIRKLLVELNIDHVDTLIGCSFGGMVALAFAELFPSYLDKLIVICAADRSSVKSIGLREIQRKIMRLGIEANKEFEAVSLARSLATVGYRGETEMEERFSGTHNDAALIHKNLNSYLEYNGNKFAANFSASKYMNLSLAIDLHQVEPANITTKTLFIGCTTDHLVPLQFIQSLSDKISGESTMVEVDCEYGHDFFLIDNEEITENLKSFISQDVLKPTTDVCIVDPQAFIQPFAQASIEGKVNEFKSTKNHQHRTDCHSSN